MKYLSHCYKSLSVVVSVLLAILIVDIALSNAATMTSVTHLSGIITFVVIAAAYSGSQYWILKFVKETNSEIIMRSRFNKILNWVVTGVQYLLTVILVSVAIQILAYSHYSTALLIWSSDISYLVAGTIMAILAAKFFLWYRSNKSFVVMIYGLSSIGVTIAMSLLIIFVTVSLIDLPSQRNIFSESTFPFFNQNTTMGTEQYVSAVADAMYFLLLWVGTALLLHQYSSKIGRIKFWLVVPVPIVFFVIQYVVISPLLAATTSGTPNSFTSTIEQILGNVAPGLAGGILFGVPFWMLARTISNTKLKNYVVIAAWGFVLLQVTTTAGVPHAPYPPFGLSSVLLTGLACYLMFVGLYSSAISVSEDARLRLMIKSSALEQSKLLFSIGSAHMEEEIKNRVLSITKKNKELIEQESGIESSLKEEDMKEYLEEVLTEIKHQKGQ